MKRTFFHGYRAADVYMRIDGSDVDFCVTLLDAEWLEENLGWHFPYFIAEGQVRNGELRFTEVKIPADECEFWYDLDTHAMEYPDEATWEQMKNFRYKYGITETNDTDEVQK